MQIHGYSSQLEYFNYKFFFFGSQGEAFLLK